MKIYISLPSPSFFDCCAEFCPSCFPCSTCFIEEESGDTDEDLKSKIFTENSDQSGRGVKLPYFSSKILSLSLACSSSEQTFSYFSLSVSFCDV